MRLPGLQRPNNLQKVAHRAGQPVQTHHEQDLPWLDLADEPRQYGPGTACTGSALLVDLGTAGCAQFIQLASCA